MYVLKILARGEDVDTLKNFSVWNILICGGLTFLMLG